MRRDDTLHFSHSFAHPSEFFAPAHFTTNERPYWAILSIIAAVLGLILAVIAWRFIAAKAGAALAAISAGALVAGAGGIMLREESTHPLPSKSREFMQLSTPGDDSELFSTRENAMQAAKEAGSRFDLPDSTARVVTYGWNEWPEEYGPPNQPDLSMDDPGWKFSGWKPADDAVIDAYVERTYGVKRTGDARVLPDTQERDLSFTLNEAKPISLPSGSARCVLTFTNYVRNYVGGPVSATPDKLVCTTAAPVPTNTLPSASPQVMYPPKQK